MKKVNIEDIKMKSIILCATQRCGSTMVCEDIRNTNELGKPEELFINWLNADIESNDWQIQLNKIIEQGSTDNNIFSIKIMSDYLENISAKLNTTLTEPMENIYEVFPRIFSDAVWVRIFRKNTIKQAISRIMARQTDICHTVEDNADDFFAGKTAVYNEAYNQNTRYNYKDILTEINNIRQEEMNWNNFFTHNNIQPIRIIYEDAVENPEKYIYEIVNAMNLDNQQIRITERKIKKLGNDLNEDWYKNTLELFAEKLFVHGKIN